MRYYQGCNYNWHEKIRIIGGPVPEMQRKKMKIN